MLDNDPTNTDETTVADQSDGPAAPPAKKAARKAPVKRAPRNAAAKATPVDPDAAADQTGTEAPAAASTDAPAVDSPAATPQAPVKKATRTRKAAARKVVAAAAEEAPAEAAGPAETAGPAVPQPVTAPFEAADPASATVPPDDSAAPAPVKAPAKRAPRKRATKVPAGVPAETAPLVAAAEPKDEERAAAELTDEERAAAEAQEAAVAAATPTLAAPVVLFQPPAEIKAPTRRRRGAKSAAGSPASTAVEPIEPAAGSDLPAATGQAAELATPGEDETDLVAADQTDTADGEEQGTGRRRRRRGRRGRGSRATDADTDKDIDSDTDSDTANGSADVAELDIDEESSEDEADHADEVAEAALSASARRRRRRRRTSGGADGADGADGAPAEDDPPNTVVHVRDSRPSGGGGGGGGGARGGAADEDGVRGVKGSTRLEAKRQRRRDNRDTGRRRAPILTEAEFLARREAVDRVMAIRQTGDLTQIAVLEDGILVEHFVTRASAQSAVGNVYLGRVQNVLPSMEAAFLDIGRGRNGVLYAGEVNWDAAGLEGKSRAIEHALSPGAAVLVQVTKDPIGHKGARLTSQISLPGRFLVYVPGGGMTGISRKLPDVERTRLKSILKKVVPDDAGVIVRTAAEGASEDDLISDVERLKAQWQAIQAKAAQPGNAPTLVYGEPDLAIRVVRDVFNDDFKQLTVAGSESHRTIADYVSDVAPDLADRIRLHTGESDLFHDLRVDEQLAKAMDRKVWLPSGGSLVIDRTEAMTVVDVNTGKYTGSGGNLEQTVTRNNIEAAEEIVRQLRLRDIGGIVVIDFIDMVLESNRDLVLRRLTECLGRDRTKHQVAEVTSLGLVQMTRKRVGEGLLEAFSEPCEHCRGRGIIVHTEPVDKRTGGSQPPAEEERPAARSRRSRGGKAKAATEDAGPDAAAQAAEADKRRAAASAIAAIAAATSHHDGLPDGIEGGDGVGSDGISPARDSGSGGDTDGGPDSHSDADGQAVVQRSDEGEFHASPTDATVVTEPVAEPSPVPAPEAVPDGDELEIADYPADPYAPSVAAARPRRRRGASRPAGPPVGLSTATTGA